MLESVAVLEEAFAKPWPEGGGGVMPDQVLIVGGGMIAHDQLLPSLYQMQRQGRIGEITVCALNGARRCERWPRREGIAAAFPGQTFRGYPGGRRCR